MKYLLFLIFLTFVTCQKEVCTDGFHLVNQKCWRWFPGAVNHTDAVRSCSSIGANLFTAKNAIDNRAMLSFLSSQEDADHLWMGLYCFGIDRSKCYWDDDESNATHYGNFAGGFPNAALGKCVYYSASGSPAGLWANGDCTQQLPYVCELPPTTPDSNCTYNYKNHCYFPMNGSVFAVAITACDQLCATLVSVHSEGENRFLASIVNNITMLGAIVSASGYTWIDGTPTDYNNDARPMDYKRGSFVSMYPGSGDFFVGDGSRNQKFICKRPTGIDCHPLPSINLQYPNLTTYSNCANPDVIMAPAIITSPGYPGNYPTNVFCTWGVQTTGSHRMQITFTWFETEIGYDLVRVYDGDSDKSPLIGTYSAGLPEFRLTTSGPAVFVTFYSDHNHVFPGFTSFVTAIF